MTNHDLEPYTVHVLGDAQTHYRCTRSACQFHATDQSKGQRVPCPLTRSDE